VEGRSITVSLENDSSLPTTEPGPKITLYQGIPKGDKLDLILQKCTELGATEIIPFIAARSVARVPEARIQERVERWRRIVLEAARQSNRFSVPEVFFAGDLANVLQLAKHSVKLLLWEEEQVGALRKTLAGFSSPLSIAVIVGPEGGLTVEEVESAGRCGFIPVSLGKRILRTETAALVVLSILQFYWGDIG
jgi:16S rRNA (uracil1498-N3)-methyltransferase